MADATGEVRRAEQDAEYLKAALDVLGEAFCKVNPEGKSPHDLASVALEHLAAAGWHLFNAEDAEKLLGAYVLQQVR